jgi:hypothetical protein
MHHGTADCSRARERLLLGLDLVANAYDMPLEVAVGVWAPTIFCAGWSKTERCLLGRVACASSI